MLIFFHFRGGGTQWISEDQSYYCWILKSYSHFFLQTSVAIHNIIVSLLSSFYAFHSHRNWKSALKNPKSHLAIILTDKHQMNVLSAEEELLGTLRSDDGDSNGNSTKAIGLITKTTILHVHHAFLYISLPSLHDYDVKMPNFTLYRGSTQATTKFPLSFCTWLWYLRIQL